MKSDSVSIDISSNSENFNGDGETRTSDDTTTTAFYNENAMDCGGDTRWTYHTSSYNTVNNDASFVCYNDGTRSRFEKNLRHIRRIESTSNNDSVSVPMPDSPPPGEHSSWVKRFLY